MWGSGDSSEGGVQRAIKKNNKRIVSLKPKEKRVLYKQKQQTVSNSKEDRTVSTASGIRRPPMTPVGDREGEMGPKLGIEDHPGPWRD